MRRIGIRLNKGDIELLVEALDELGRARWRSERAHMRVARETKNHATKGRHESAAATSQREQIRIAALRDWLEECL